jgi:enoyl-CoA hydratase/carnithine racemase
MVSALEPAALLRRVPLGEVLRLALFGLDERLSAQRAREICLVSEVVPRERLWERAATLARRLAEKPPLAVQGTVKAIWDSLHMSVQGAREIPLHYPQLGNPGSQVDLAAVPRPEFELR